MMCKLPWCSNAGSPLPFDNYCSLDHRDFHEYELEAEGYREEIAKLRRQCADQQLTIDSHELEILAMRDQCYADREKIIKLREQRQVLMMAIEDHYHVWRTNNWRMRLAQNQHLWRVIGIPEDDIDNVRG